MNFRKLYTFNVHMVVSIVLTGVAIYFIATGWPLLFMAILMVVMLLNTIYMPDTLKEDCEQDEEKK